MPDASPLAAPPALRRFLIAIVLVALGFNLWCLTRYWRENFRDAYESRQYQTALTAFYFQKDGLKLAYETPVLGPPWSVPMEFPLYQAIVAKLATATGLPLEQAGRLTGILAFFGCFPAVWLLLKSRLPHSEDRLVIVALALVSPLFLFYSRTVLIESTALCVSLWFLAVFDAAIRQPSAWRLLAAWILGGLAAATKITTFVAICLPAVGIVAASAWERRRQGSAWWRAIHRPLGVAALVASVPLAVGFAWIVYSDHLKELNPYGHSLTSSSLREFNFGPLSLRFTLKFWRAVGYHSFQHIVSIPALGLTVLGFFVVAPAYRRFALVCVGCYCVGFLTFANLYYVHDYYYYASAFFLIAAVGSIAAGLLRSPRVRSGIAMGAVTVLLFSGYLAFWESYGGFYRRPNLPAPAIAAVLRAATKPTDVFVALNFDWNSMIPYYAQRRAIMMFQSHTKNIEVFRKSAANLKPETVAALLVGEPDRKSASFLQLWLSELGMELQPIASTEDGDLYVRRDLSLTVAARLDGHKFPGVALHLPEKLNGWHDLTGDTWPAQLAMATPAPYASRGEYPVGMVTVDHVKAMSVQAPAEILIRPPAGARHIQMRGGMMPGSYQNGNTTDGVVLEIREERPDGTIKTLFQRGLLPLDHPDDRQEVVVDYAQDAPFEGVLVFGAYPGPTGSAAFDWVYWRSITVH